MATAMNLELVAPERLLFSGEVQQVTVPGSEGEFTVFAGHAPVVAILRPGVVTLIDGNGKEEKLFVRGGFAEATPEGLKVLAEQAVPLAELDQAALAQEIKNAEEDVADARDDKIRARAQERLDHLRQLQASL